MITEDQANQLATHWVEAWNTHDLDKIMSHYADNVVLTSPVAARLLGDPSGTVAGKTALRAYFQKGLAAYPQLHFELIDTLSGVNSVVLYYINQNRGKTAEYMEMDTDGKVSRVVANYLNAQ